LVYADAQTGELPQKALLRAAARVFVAALPQSAPAATPEPSAPQ
jgi:hypothetical protein